MEAAALLPTSEISFHSTAHGALRRTQRNISKRDLQSAVKYGSCERGRYHPKLGPTWKIRWMNLVYITNDAKDTEITSWVDELPLEPVVISERMRQQYDEAKKRLAAEPGSATSHTVFVVDKSASMLNSDVDGHRTRARGVYYLLAEEYLSPSLHPVDRETIGGDNMRYTDVASLVEMRDGATIVFEREPVSWIMYNKFVELAAASDNKFAKGSANGCRGNGNYFDSVCTALSLLSTHVHEKLSLTLHFLTDGMPSDKATRGKVRGGQDAVNAFPEDMLGLLKDFIALHEKQFTMEVFALGTASHHVLEMMVDAVNASGASAKFGQGGRDLVALCNSLTSLVSSTVCVSNMLSRLHFAKEDRVVAVVDRETYNASAAFTLAHWNVYKPDAMKGDWTLRRLTRVAKKSWSGEWHGEWEQQQFLNDNAVGFAVKKKIFGEGAERIVYEMTEVDGAGQPVGMPLVAKDSKYLKKQDSKRERFHGVFIKTQTKAASLAHKFNARLNRMGVNVKIPRIHFLPCSVYDCRDAPSAYLAEKRLNPALYRKWNDNAGGIDGIARVNLAQAPLRVAPLAAFAEGDEEEESDVDDDAAAEDEEGPDDSTKKPARVLMLEAKILDRDVVQAFTHWTYFYSKRKFMVCDLQGELTLAGSEPVFELTDPCIHSKYGKRYGATDKGEKGMHEFFKTHQCNPACELLNINHGGY